MRVTFNSIHEKIRTPQIDLRATQSTQTLSTERRQQMSRHSFGAGLLLLALIGVPCPVWVIRQRVPVEEV